MNKLIDKSNEVPKMGLVYGDPGLGKTQTAVWWAGRNDAVYVRAQNKMTSRWLMEKIVFELGESPSRKMANLMEQCIAHLRLKPQVIIIGEVVRKTEEDFHIVECFNPESNLCKISPECQLKFALNQALKAYIAVLDSYTLDDVLVSKDALAELFGITKS